MPEYPGDMDGTHTIAPTGPDPALVARQTRGRRAYLSGVSAEQAVERAYLRRGCVLLGRRVRAGPGELDLVFRRGNLVVFVEVKSSSSHSRAIESLTGTQLQRIIGAAACFCASQPDLAGLDMRFDLAAVDGTGRIRVVPNITL